MPQSPGIRRLAVQVEDHDLSFGDFEGQIPNGVYGTGKIKYGIKEVMSRAARMKAR